jgi:hypothetical protein
MRRYFGELTLVLQRRCPTVKMAEQAFHQYVAWYIMHKGAFGTEMALAAAVVIDVHPDLV